MSETTITLLTQHTQTIEAGIKVRYTTQGSRRPTCASAAPNSQPERWLAAKPLNTINAC